MGDLFWGIFLSVALSALGGAGIFWEVHRARRSRIWPHTYATIMDSGIIEKGDDSVYHVYLLYRYVVDGWAHEGKKEINNLQTTTRGGAEKIWSMYPVGRTDLPIAYNPRRAEQHLIADDFHSRLNAAWIVFCVAVVCAGLGLLFMIALMMAS